MSRRVKEFVDVADHVSLDALIASLSELRDALPEGSEAELRLRGDEVFGHRITITYFRDQTEAEARVRAALCRSRPRGQGKAARAAPAELGKVCYAAPGKRGKLRIVA